MPGVFGRTCDRSPFNCCFVALKKGTTAKIYTCFVLSYLIRVLLSRLCVWILL